VQRCCWNRISILLGEDRGCCEENATGIGERMLWGRMLLAEERGWFWERTEELLAEEKGCCWERTEDARREQMMLGENR
jgi:hypothetical protein